MATAQAPDLVLDHMIQGPREMKRLMYSPDGQNIAIMSGSTITMYSIDQNVFTLVKTFEGCDLTSGCWVDGFLCISIADSAGTGFAPATVLHAGNLSVASGKTLPATVFTRILASGVDSRVAAVKADSLIVMDIESGKEMYRYKDPFGFITEMAWSGDGNYIASVDTDARMVVHDLTRNASFDMRFSELQTSHLDWSTDNRYVYNYNCVNRTIDLIDLTLRRMVSSTYLPFYMTSVDFDAVEGIMYFGASLDLLVYDLAGSKVLSTYCNASGSIFDIRLIKASGILVTASDDGFLRVYADRNGTGYNEAPTVKVLEPSEGESFQGGFEARGTVTDDGDFLTAFYRINGLGWRALANPAEWSVTVTAAEMLVGANIFVVKATDGDKESVISVNFLFQGDTVPNERPSVSIVSPADNASVDPLIEVSGTSSDDVRVEEVWLRVDQGEWLRASGTSNWSFVYLASQRMGEWITIDARASDGVLPSDIDTVRVLVRSPVVENVTRPWVHLIAPTENEIVVLDLRCEGTTVDTGGNASTYVSFDGQSWELLSESPTWERSFPTTRLQAGRCEVWFLAFDGEALSDTVSVNITMVPYLPPVVTISSPEPNAVFFDDIHVTGTVASGHGAIDAVLVKVGDGPWTAATGGREWSFGASDGGLPYGDVVLEVKASDDYATSEIVSTVLFHYRPPELVITNPSTGTRFNESLTVTGRIVYGLPDNLTIEMRTSGQVWRTVGPCSREWTVELDSEGLEPGNVVLELRAFDGVSYSGVQNLTVIFSPKPQVGEHESGAWIVASLLILAGLVAVIGIWYGRRGTRT